MVCFCHKISHYNVNYDSSLTLFHLLNDIYNIGPILVETIVLFEFNAKSSFEGSGVCSLKYVFI